MAIQQLQIPSSGINNTVDQAQWSQLAGLGDVYQKAQAQARQQQALASLGTDPQANMQTLLTSQDPQLAQAGLNMQQQAQQRADQLQQRAEQVREFNAQQALRTSAEKRAQATFEEDSPEARAAKVTAAGLDPNDPNNRAYIATGQNMPSPIQASAEKRAQTLFEQGQRYSTREGRLQAVKDGELDINDPEIRRWVALGGDIPDPAKNRLGLTPTYTQDTAGNVHALQLSATGQPVEVKVPPGQTILGPGQTAQQKAQGAAVGKATGAAQATLPDVVRNLDATGDTIDAIMAHPGKSAALGRGSQLPDWMVTGTDIGDFRTRVQQLAGEAMQQSMASLRGSGLGSVSDFEQKTMISAFVQASTAQTEKQFNESMATAKRSLDKIRDIARAKARGDFSERPGASTPAAAAKPDPLGLR